VPDQQKELTRRKESDRLHGMIGVRTKKLFGKHAAINPIT
jgi:hypothetical protein